jgi:GEVED domain
LVELDLQGEIVKYLLVILICFSLAGCYKSVGSVEDDSDTGHSDSDTYTSADADADTDTDTDADTDTDTDSDTDTDTDADTDTDTDSDVDVDADNGNGFDLGDAPLPYPTLIENDGARHAILKGFYLGWKVDAESDGQPQEMARGDDKDGMDDEDGVYLPVTGFRVPSTNELTVTCASPNIRGYLQVWIDLNIDGDWADENEHVIKDWPLDPGPNTFTIISDESNWDLGDTFARFRFSSKKGLSPTGFAPDGEVEDFPITIDP